MLEMLNALISGLIQCFSWATFSLMLIGIIIGFVVGILPGLGGPTAMALMLPFIFKMSAVEAFAFLLGMTAVTATTGDITSVLFGVPGEPTTASTIVDGHSMARNGEAGRALGAVLMSSLVGAVFGAVAIAVAIPVVRPLVLSFGSPEFFMLSLLGITFVAALSGEDILKGMVSGGIGLMLATIGLDPISGIQRYTFNQLFLWDGIGLVPITIGFYAIPETIELAVLGTIIIQGIVPGPDMLIPEPRGHLGLTFSFVWVIIISNIVTVGISFLFLEPLARITQVRGGIIIRIILVLVYLGAFSEKNAFEDMLVVLFFGGLGWIMEKLEWPRPPVLLGLALGPLAENRLFLSTDHYVADC